MTNDDLTDCTIESTSTAAMRRRENAHRHALGIPTICLSGCFTRSAPSPPARYEPLRGAHSEVCGGVRERSEPGHKKCCGAGCTIMDVVKPCSRYQEPSTGGVGGTDDPA